MSISSTGSSGFKRITGAIVARALMPTNTEVKQCMVYTDLAMKLEIVIFDLCSSLWWSSMAEYFVFLFALMLFFTDTSTMSFIWMFIPHLVRGGVALTLVKRMPKSHDMVGNI